MKDHPGILPHHEPDGTEPLLDQAAATAIDILGETLPDTFLRQKHYDPTPLPEDVERLTDHP